MSASAMWWAVVFGVALGTVAALLVVRAVAWFLASLIPLRRASVRATLRRHYRFITTLEGEGRYGRVHAALWAFNQARYFR